ncbi:hypothetical protein [Pontibaca methylaminivorans]|uniref:Uncharacterized protein n=1 Tax=Pontibaca methylaminivorans TaxID=515897 RepID=A0A1R3X8B6_9RHOB|nr:hypothetical protein [Pontibaca methylaminivorans]SIT86652.1 hypothetical protein SAMN05421849_2356 [Pontibaca methylaminivorans]
MANASSRKFGPGQQDQGKGSGEGGMTPDAPGIQPKTEILSNRDTSRHSDSRGLDGAHVQNQELQDRDGNRRPEDRDDGLPEWERDEGDETDGGEETDEDAR